MVARSCSFRTTFCSSVWAVFWAACHFPPTGHTRPHPTEGPYQEGEPAGLAPTPTGRAIQELSERIDAACASYPGPRPEAAAAG